MRLGRGSERRSKKKYARKRKGTEKKGKGEKREGLSEGGSLPLAPFQIPKIMLMSRI